MLNPVQKPPYLVFILDHMEIPIRKLMVIEYSYKIHSKEANIQPTSVMEGMKEAPRRLSASFIRSICL
jgi:hypothetical protein